MKRWHVISAVTLVVLLIAAWRIHSIERERNAPGVQTSRYKERPLTEDELVVPRKMFIDSLQSARALDGKPVWIKAGYEIDYYPYHGKQIDYAHKAGVLPGAQEMDVKDAIEIKAPAGWTSHVPRGDKNVFLVFTEPGKSEEFAAPVAVVEGGKSTYYCDDVLYYQDPHQLYKHWPAEVWQAVEQHQAKPGMNELQVAMALGQLQKSESSTLGNRTVIYTLEEPGGMRHVSVTFVNNQATAVKAS